MLGYRSGRSAARLARLLREQEVGGSTPLAPTIFFILVLSVLLSSCTPAPRYYAKKAESQQVIEQTIAAAGDSTVRALRLAPPVKHFTRSRITSPFGARNNPRRSGREFHEGIDIKANGGEEIVAAAAGTVAFAGKQRGYGTMVVLDHGSGVSTVYAHLFYANVRKREGVSAGQNIGRAGKRGAATGTHLHFEIRRGGKALDPMPHLWLDSMTRSPY